MSFFDKFGDRNWTWSIWFVAHVSLLLAKIVCICIHVTKPNLDLPTRSKASLPTLGCGEGSCSFYCKLPSKDSRQLVLKRPELPYGFQGKVFKDRLREGGCGVCDQLADILLIGWWWGNQESTSSTFWFQLVWGLRACGQRTDNFFYLVGVLASVKQLKGRGSEYYL